MSTLGARAEVRFSNAEMDPVTLDIPVVENSSLSFNSHVSSGATTPRSILKAGPNVENWLHTDPGIDDDVFNSIPGLHQWTQWRTMLNSAMVDLIEKRKRLFTYSNTSKRHSPRMKDLVEPGFLISQQASEFALQRAVLDHVTGREGLYLQAPTFISFGLPRVKLRINSSYNSEDSTGSDPRDTGSETHESTSDSCQNAVSNSPNFSSDGSMSDISTRLCNQTTANTSQIDNTDKYLPMHKTVVIVSSTHLPISGSSNDADDTESLCAIIDMRDDSDDGF